jgi:putative transposase
MQPISCARHRFPPVVIRHAVWLYLCFTLSYRDVEDLLAERGLDVSNETIRRWMLKFGPAIARNLRCAGERHRTISGTSMRWSSRSQAGACTCGGRSTEGEVLDVMVQPRRDKAAAVKLLRKLLKRQGVAPTVIVTDKLRSYARRCRRSGSRDGTSRICAPTTGPKPRTSRCDDGSARCRASNRPLQLSVSSPSTPPSTTSSTSSDT